MTRMRPGPSTLLHRRLERTTDRGGQVNSEGGRKNRLGHWASAEEGHSATALHVVSEAISRARTLRSLRSYGSTGCASGWRKAIGG